MTDRPPALDRPAVAARFREALASVLSGSGPKELFGLGTGTYWTASLSLDDGGRHVRFQFGHGGSVLTTRKHAGLLRSDPAAAAAWEEECVAAILNTVQFTMGAIARFFVSAGMSPDAIAAAFRRLAEEALTEYVHGS